ncbi:hypothetical protein BUE80_DR003258 [Diplocarpon rosae]|nr:hypothetical protein BUE80_DR003258 [Diplocarpon rosae]
MANAWSLDTRKDELEYHLTEHLRLNGLYWGLTALHLLKHPEALPRKDTIDFVLSCQAENGGFGAAPGHDAHILYTCSAVQILAMSCANFDGGYGVSPGAESHSGQIYACLAALSIAGEIRLVDKDKLGRWLSERQVEQGGLNGRAEKLEDVCYSWWVGSSLAMIGRLRWVDGEALSAFILRCQDPEMGGIADRPGDVVDVFHTVFGIAGLSLLGYPDLEEVDPVYCMPRKIIEREIGPANDNES